MPLAITLRIDARDAGRISALWWTLIDAGHEAARRNLAYTPHLTLAILEADPALEGELAETIADLAADTSPLSLALTGPAFFPGPPQVLYLAVVPSGALLALHRALHDRIAARHGDLARHAHYLPDAFVPHVTLCEAVDDPAAALNAMPAGAWPLVVRASRLELVRFHPAKVLAGCPMA